MDLGAVLDDCLDRMQAGASAGDCLASYPEAATELAPLLNSAARLAVLRGASVPVAERIAAKITVRQALSGAKTRRAGASSRGLGWLAGLRRRRPGWAVAGGVAVLIVASSIWLATSAAASGPGDWSYGVRVVAERVPVWLQFSAEPRAAAELAISERRLDELKRYVQRDGKFDARAMNAMLSADEAAHQAAGKLPLTERMNAAARLEAHSRSLRALAAEGLPSPAIEALEKAAARLEAMSQDFQKQPAPLPATPAPTNRPADDKGEDRLVPGLQLEVTPGAAVDVTPEVDGPGEKRGHTRAVPGKALGHSQPQTPVSSSSEFDAKHTEALKPDPNLDQPAATGTPAPAQLQAQPAVDRDHEKGADSALEPPGSRGKGHQAGESPGQDPRGSPSPPGLRR